MRKQVTVVVSDFSHREVKPGEGATIVVRFDDPRQGGPVTVDAHLDDDLLQKIVSSGKQEKRRGRKPKGTVPKPVA